MGFHPWLFTFKPFRLEHDIMLTLKGLSMDYESDKNFRFELIATKP